MNLEDNADVLTMQQMLLDERLPCIALSYITDTLQRQFTLQPVTRARLHFSKRAFSVAVPRLWNSLPVDTRNAAKLHTFKKKL